MRANKTAGVIRDSPAKGLNYRRWRRRKLYQNISRDLHKDRNNNVYPQMVVQCLRNNKCYYFTIISSPFIEI